MTTPIQPKRMSEEERRMIEYRATATMRPAGHEYAQQMAKQCLAHILAVEDELADRTRSYTEANKAATFYAQSYQRVLDELAEAVGLLQYFSQEIKASYYSSPAWDKMGYGEQYDKAAAFIARQEGKTNE